VVEQLLLLFQALFLVLLYLFIWRIVRSASRDLRLPQEESFVLAPPVRAAPVVERGRLVVVSGPTFPPGTAFAIGDGPIGIGRSADNAIALDGDAFASTRHARVEPFREGIWLVDLESRNGTRVNGEPVDGRVELAPGDLVQVGETALRLER
jgi:hypothetical protein